MNKLETVGFFNPSSADITLGSDDAKRRQLYAAEKREIKKDFAAYGEGILDINAPDVQKRLTAIARKVINVAVDQVAFENDIIPLVLPIANVNPGDTYVTDELSGPMIYQGSYGAPVQMSRPNVQRFTVTTSLKEVGIELVLQQIAAGKYSPSELGDYTAKLAVAWRNRMLFTNTLSGLTAYQSGGARYVSAPTLSAKDIEGGLAKLSDEADPKVFVGRRKAVHALSQLSGFSDETKREFEVNGKLGRYIGAQVVQVYGYQDNDYGLVYPMLTDDLWLFSSQPAGVWVTAAGLRTTSETIARSETLNMYFRWDDGVGIDSNKLDRIVRFAGVTVA